MLADVIAGTDGRLAIDGTNLNLDQYSLEIQADGIPAVGFEDVAADGAIWDQTKPGMRRGKLKASGYWDAGLNPHDDPPGITVGAELTNVHLFVSKTTNRYYVCGDSITVLSCTIDNKIKDRVNFSFSADCNGEVVYPD